MGNGETITGFNIYNNGNWSKICYLTEFFHFWFTNVNEWDVVASETVAKTVYKLIGVYQFNWTEAKNPKNIFFNQMYTYKLWHFLRIFSLHIRSTQRWLSFKKITTFITLLFLSLNKSNENCAKWSMFQSIITENASGGHWRFQGEQFTLLARFHKPWFPCRTRNIPSRYKSVVSELYKISNLKFCIGRCF